MMNKWIATAALVLASGSAADAAPTQGSAERPTIVLVHGAFAESSSWDGVTGRLLREGYPVIAAANPLRGIKEDGAYLAQRQGVGFRRRLRPRAWRERR
jgi:pimeloyl-ACP methyl ester carboxylesterase